MAPAFIPHGPTHPVVIAIDDTHFTQWIGDPPTVWQTPLSEVRDLDVRAGRTVTLRATIGGVRYRWRTRRGPEHAELVERVRALGTVERPRRPWVPLAASAAFVLAVSSVAAVLAGSVSTSSRPSLATTVGAVNVGLADLPAGWGPTPEGTLLDILGNAGTTYPSRPGASPAPSGVLAAIYDAAGRSFQSCMGVSASADRMFGAAGQEPEVQVTGTIYGTTTAGGPEIGSLTQYYASTTMVDHDVAEYRRPAFGRCWGLVSAQLFAGVESESAAATEAKYLASTFTPATFVHGFKAGGIATVAIPGSATYTLVSLFAASGHYEVNLYALTTDWAATRTTVVAAFNAMLARITTLGGAST